MNQIQPNNDDPNIDPVRNTAENEGKNYFEEIFKPITVGTFKLVLNFL
jgi:hypothetical protein